MGGLPSHAALCEAIVDECQVAVIFADASGSIRLWNKGAETIFGFTSQEAIGRSMDIIIPERQRARHWEGYERVMRTGVTRYGREVLAVPATRKDGTRISLEFTIALVRDDKGAVLGAGAIVQDVTARWERAKALRARLAAAEKQTETAKATS